MVWHDDLKGLSQSKWFCSNSIHTEFVSKRLHENILKLVELFMFEGFQKGKGRDKNSWVLFWRASILKRSYVTLCKWFLSAWLDFIRIWLSAVPNSTAVLTSSVFWLYQLIFHYWTLWLAFQMRKERFLAWIPLSFNFLFWINTLLSPLYIKGSLGCTRYERNVFLKKTIFYCEGEMK